MSADLARKLEDLEPFEHYPYASYVKARTGGEFKRHKTLAHARSATNTKNSWNRGHNPIAAVYRWDTDTEGWEPLDA